MFLRSSTQYSWLNWGELQLDAGLGMYEVCQSLHQANTQGTNLT